MVHAPCIGYKIIFSDDAKKDLKKLETQIISKIFEKVRILTSPESNTLNTKKLKTRHCLYRIRIGDFRVVYCIKQEKIIVYVVAVGHRKNVYDILDRRFKNSL